VNHSDSMRLNNSLFITFILTLVTYSCYSRNTVSPLSYGVLKAKNGVERYEALMRCHKDASTNGYGVDYHGIDSLFLEIPQNAESIPLSNFTDFAGVTIVVFNRTHEMSLFAKMNIFEEMYVKGQDIDDGQYSNYPNLKRGAFLLSIEDKTPWTERIGYTYNAVRRDIMMINNGKSKDRPISSYITPASRPQCMYCKADLGKKEIKNIYFVRSKQSTKKTYFIYLDGQYNVEINNVRIYTPIVHREYGDRAINISNSYAVSLKNVNIEGTYSQKDRYGYGINMNNVNRLEVVGMKAAANWGVFGTSNLQNVSLINSNINRFDIHCYGRNVIFENCKFMNEYNQFSSMFGEVRFENCNFYECTPFLLEASYDAYPKFKLVFKNCRIYAAEKKNALIVANGLHGGRTKGRSELRKQEFPDVYIDGLKIYLQNDVCEYYIYKIGRKMMGLPQDIIPGVRDVKDVIVNRNFNNND